MVEKSVSSEVLGLEITSTDIKGALLTIQQGKPALSQLFHIPLDKGESAKGNVKPLYIGSEEQIFRQTTEDCLYATALPPSEALVRKYTIALRKEKDINSALEFQIEPIIPYSIDEAIIDRINIRQFEGGTELTVIIVREDHLALHLEKWSKVNVEPEVVTASPAALAAFSKELSPNQMLHIVLHLGKDEICCSLVRQGKLIASQSSSCGSELLYTSLAKDKQISEAEAIDEMDLVDFNKLDPESEIAKTLKLIEAEITKCILSLSKLTKGEQVNEILVTGKAMTINNLQHVIANDLNKEIIEPQVTTNFAILKEELQSYAIPIGTALSCLPKAQNQINFRQKNYTYPYPWKRLKKPMSIYLGLSILVALSLYFYGYATIAKNEDDLKSEYIELLAKNKISYSDFENEYSTSTGALTISDPIDLTSDDMMDRLIFFEKKIKSTPEIFALYPNIPKVSDVLAWLSNLDYVVGEDRDESLKYPRISLDSFSYKMIKRPEKNKSREKYQVRVEIEFTPQNATYAREFRDVLQTPNDYIDPNNEIKWSTDRGKYKASFILKDKTQYPK